MQKQYSQAYYPQTSLDIFNLVIKTGGFTEDLKLDLFQNYHQLWLLSLLSLIHAKRTTESWAQMEIILTYMDEKQKFKLVQYTQQLSQLSQGPIPIIKKRGQSIHKLYLRSTQIDMIPSIVLIMRLYVEIQALKANKTLAQDKPRYLKGFKGYALMMYSCMTKKYPQILEIIKNCVVKQYFQKLQKEQFQYLQNAIKKANHFRNHY